MFIVYHPRHIILQRILHNTSESRPKNLWSFSYFFGGLCLLFSIHIRAFGAFEKTLFQIIAEVYWRLKRDKFHGL